jgi:lipopolysaccharide export system ATP-binding protein
MDPTTLPLDGPAAAPIVEPPVAHGLQVVSIAKSYDKRTVLTDVSVSVGRGEVVGLLGPNGAGKTTCF